MCNRAENARYVNIYLNVVNNVLCNITFYLKALYVEIKLTTGCCDRNGDRCENNVVFVGRELGLK